MRFCFSCGREINEFAKVCPYCGTPVAQQKAAPAADPNAPVPSAAPVNPAAPNAQPMGYVPQPMPAYAQPQVNVMTNAPITKESLPAQFRPLSAWAYFGLTLLYAVPLVGLVFMIVFSFSSGNINRRSFTRSFWIPIFIALGLFLILLLISVISGNGIDFEHLFRDLF